MFSKVDDVGVGMNVQWETVPSDRTSHTKCPLCINAPRSVNVFFNEHYVVGKCFCRFSSCRLQLWLELGQIHCNSHALHSNIWADMYQVYSGNCNCYNFVNNINRELANVRVY